jgi:uncharacterized protein YjbJ (UPF0337 family)
MGGRVDETKGRAKKAAGEVTGDPGLRQEGRIDKASGAVKRGVGRAADRLKQGTRRSRARRRY